MPALDLRLIETAGAPAREALRATASAAAVARELDERGSQVRFTLVSTHDRVAVMLCDADGTVLTHLTPSRALDIAAGLALQDAPAGP